MLGEATESSPSVLLNNHVMWTFQPITPELREGPVFCLEPSHFHHVSAALLVLRGCHGLNGIQQGKDEATGLGRHRHGLAKTLVNNFPWQSFSSPPP